MLQFLVSSNCIELRSKDRVFQQNHHWTTTTVSTFPPLLFISQKEVVMQHMDRIAKKIRIHISHQIDLTQHLTIFTIHWKAPKWSVHTAVKSAWLLFHLETSNLFLFLDFCFLVSIVFWNMIESGVWGRYNLAVLKLHRLDGRDEERVGCVLTFRQKTHRCNIQC